MEAELRATYLAVLGADNVVRKQAEAYLTSLESTPGFLLVNLQIIQSAPTTPQDVAVRQSAAVLFKNVVKKLWVPSEEGGATISLSDRNAIKTHLVDLMCTTSPDIQKQLAEVVTVIAKHDFPAQWLTLLPQLIEKLKTTDFRVIQGVMLTANSIFKKFRFIYKSEELMGELKYCLESFQTPLLEIYKMVGNAVPGLSNDKEALVISLETIRLMTRIFFSLNWQDLPEFFEDNITVWMEEFSKYLTYHNPILVNAGETIEPGPIEKLQAAIVENLSLYVTKYEEEFAPHLAHFTQLVWRLLMEVSVLPKYDNLATQAIKFLTSVSSKRANAALFSETVIRDIIEQIVIRNLTATDADEELFEDNPTDFIRKDIEGSDQDTRRRCATELIRSLLKVNAGTTSSICFNYVGSMLSQYVTSKDWRAKDAALHLMLAVSTTSSSVAQGVGELNPLTNLSEIFTLQVVPELQDLNVNARPIVKADAIKLLCLFRNQLDTSMLLALLPDVIRHLNSTFVVVQTYAALTIERLLSLKVKGAGTVTGSSSMRITKEHLAPYLEPMFTGLFNVLDNPDLPENDYVMKAVMRLLVVMGGDITAVTPLVLGKLMLALERVSKNPANPHFNHYMFECIAVLIRSCCAVADPTAATAACDQLETLLFPSFMQVLSLDVVEFVPYVFQILAELLLFRPNAGLSDNYKKLIHPILTPVLWERKGNAPALTDLVVAYVRKGMADIEAAGSVQPLLGVFQKLLSSRATDKLALTMLDTLVACNHLSSLRAYVPTIWQLLLTKLKEGKSGGYPRQFFHTLAVFVIHYGAATVVESLESVSSGVFTNLVLQVWSPQAESIASGDETESHEILVGGTILLCDPLIASQPELWGRLLRSLLFLLSPRSRDVMLDLVLEEGAEERGFDSAYSKLAYCQLPELEHSKEVSQAPLFFARSLAELCRSSPGKYAPILQVALNEENLSSLGSLLQQYGFSIV